jgi:hypothetical protein
VGANYYVLLGGAVAQIIPRSFPSAARRAFAPSCITIRYSTWPYILDLLRMRREQVALHLERDSNREDAHWPKDQSLDG